MSDQDEIYVDGMTYDEFRALPEEVRRERYFLPMTQHGATLAGFWKDCELARCRRSKCCTGRLTATQLQRGSGYHGMFPPCTRAQHPRRAMIITAIHERYPPDGNGQPKYDGRRPSETRGR